MRLGFVFILYLLSSLASAQEGIDGLNGVSAVVPVGGTKYQIDSGYLNERSLDSFLKSFYTQLENVTPISNAKSSEQRKLIKSKRKNRRKLTVDVHVPAELSSADKTEFMDKIERKFAKWDNVEIRMQEISVTALRNRATEENRNLQIAEKVLPSGSVHPQVRPTLEKENNTLPKNHETWLKGWKTNTVFQVARIFPLGAGIASASLLVSKIGLQTPLAVAIGATIGLIEVSSQYATNRWAIEFNNWKEQVTLPHANKLRWVYWLNERHFFKAAMFNFTVFAMAKTSIYRSLMSSANPSIGGLSADFFGQIAAAGAGGAIFGALGHIGFRDMVKNGYVGPNIRKYLVWGLALQGIVGGGLITAGATEMVPYMIAFNWGGKRPCFPGRKNTSSQSKQSLCLPRRTCSSRS